MLINITLSAEKELIEQARRLAEANHTTRNAEFRQWLDSYVHPSHIETDLDDLMARLNYAQPGTNFTREELNER